MDEAPLVRRATAAEVPALAGMLMRAFLDDPVAAWAFPAPAARPRALELFQAIRLRQVLGEQEVWTDDGLACAALWLPPGSWHSSVREQVEIGRCFMHPRLVSRIPRAAIGWTLLERAHPREPPSWYLAVLGTEPAAQGRGLGSAVLAPVLESCDRDGVGAYLESSKERNIDFYARHGFRVLEELRLLGGPPVWRMWRDPRS